MGTRHLKFSNRFTALRIGPIELKLGRILLDTSTYDIYLERGASAHTCGQSVVSGWGVEFDADAQQINVYIIVFHALAISLCSAVSNFSPCWTIARFLNVPNSTASGQSVELGIERSRFRQSLVPSGSSLRQGN